MGPSTSVTDWDSGWFSFLPLVTLLIYNFLQVMYSFVMRPESLPKSYQDFIQKTGPVAKPVYKAVRDCCRGFPVDISSLSAYLSKRRNSNYVKLEEFPSIIPCSIIHPDTHSCLAHNAKATSATFRKTFPLYFSLTFVPFVVLHLQKVYSLLISTFISQFFLPQGLCFQKKIDKRVVNNVYIMVRKMKLCTNCT